MLFESLLNIEKRKNSFRWVVRNKKHEPLVSCVSCRSLPSSVWSEKKTGVWGRSSPLDTRLPGWSVSSWPSITGEKGSATWVVISFQKVKIWLQICLKNIRPFLESFPVAFRLDSKPLFAVPLWFLLANKTSQPLNSPHLCSTKDF